jgi:N-acetylglucosaminyl-diphospho-decaprenol L-rhamnosyltransferase
LTVPARPAARGNDPATTLDIVVVNWNAGSYLGDCLRSVAATSRTQFELSQVVVVDNASIDGSLENLEKVAVPLTILRNEVNRGFAAACNQGAREGNADLLLFLNPDARLYRETLDLTIAFMIDPQNSSIGICGGRVVGDGGTEEYSCARFPTLWMWVAKMFGLASAIPRLVPRQRVSTAELGASGIVDQVIGAYFLIRRPLFESLRGFDERFFVYLEDVDLAYRAAKLGYPSYFISEVPVYHLGGASSEQVGGMRLFYLLRGRTEYARKHWPRWQAWVLAFMILAVELPVRWLVASTNRERSQAKNVREAALNYVRYLLSR